MQPTTSTHWKFNAVGVVALLLWASSIPFARRCAEELGPFTAISIQYIVSGLLGLIALGASRESSKCSFGFLRNREFLFRLFFFSGYVVLLYTAITLVPRDKLPVVTLLNYLWPTLTMVLTVLLLRQPVRGILFGVGSLIVLSGLTLEIVGEDIFALLRESGSSLIVIAYASATAAALFWGLYSVLNRKWGERAGGARALPFLLVFSGLGVLILRFAVQESSNFSPEIAVPLLYLCVMPILANLCWDVGSRRGSITLLSLLADALPWASLTIANLYLGIAISPNTWLSAALIILGALTSRVALLAPKTR